MPKNPVAYAEESLGVHLVWERALETLGFLEKARDDLLSVNQQIRLSEELLEDREFDLVGSVKVRHPEASQAELGRLAKETIHDDSPHRHRRKELSEFKTAKDGYSTQVRGFERRLDALQARMIELGGLLNFYSAAQLTQAQNTTQGAA